ncbi:hypothetical protein [Paenibacillus fonticola]|uniref:hypothetical protein n=1 Tax=Paenibacillus fonticola TaxID=379896 RepID=UPI00036291FC|nr:hypothetical protein [Paenibacillus fonticola]
MLKKTFLLLGTFLIAFANFSTFVGLYFWNTNRKTAVICLMITLVIFIFYIILLFTLRKKFSSTFLVLNLLLYVIVFVNGPQMQLYAIEIKYYFEIPSNKMQKQLNQEVAAAIENTNIPYRVNAEKSKKMTKERREVVVVLIKTTGNELQKTEIDKITAQAFSKDVTLSFYDYGEEWIVDFYFTDLKEIKFCYPYTKCDELEINYTR